MRQRLAGSRAEQGACSTETKLQNLPPRRAATRKEERRRRWRKQTENDKMKPENEKERKMENGNREREKKKEKKKRKTGKGARVVILAFQPILDVFLLS